MKKVSIILFDEFETLDVFGPVQIIGRLDSIYKIDFFSLQGGPVKSSQGYHIDTKDMRTISDNDLLIVPGGIGTRKLVNNKEFISVLQRLGSQANFVLGVCTGSALLAKTTLLDYMVATSNKMAFDWVASLNPKVAWMSKARWCVDGNLYTSSGISAGMDMTLGFISDRHGEDIALRTAKEIEYTWNSNKEDDPFAVIFDPYGRTISEK